MSNKTKIPVFNSAGILQLDTPHLTEEEQLKYNEVFKAAVQGPQMCPMLDNLHLQFNRSKHRQQ